MPLTIGLVVEGPTDLVVLKPLIQEWLAGFGEAGTVDFINLQPTDKTSGAGVWLVKEWAKQNPPEARHEELLSRPLFAGLEPTCDLVLVQLDADIVLDIAQREGLDLPDTVDASAKGALTKRVMERWLWPHEARPAEDQHVLLCAVQSTETWIVAGHHSDLPNPEEIDPVPMLLALNPGLARQGAPHKLRKNTTMWGKLYRRHLQGEVRGVADRCPHLKEALVQLQEHLGGG